MDSIYPYDDTEKLLVDSVVLVFDVLLDDFGTKPKGKTIQ